MSRECIAVGSGQVKSNKGVRVSLRLLLRFADDDSVRAKSGYPQLLVFGDMGDEMWMSWLLSKRHGFKNLELWHV